ncbi:hypothetical protein AVEN_25507-1 [Araneus ventricosus]|uniref:Uncharacterized protein n=1 Tax=Araneus ventricosus TaxID=182803 RepID=A0A4Y2CU92_ARAVE|nr:hypothetical protein AVEN_25507-1 [Araneus ventricosus]
MRCMKDRFITNEGRQEDNSLRFSLVILASRFDATRGLFWHGARNSEPRSDDEDDTPSPKFHATPTGGRLATTYDLTCNRPHTRRIFSGIGFRTWNSAAPRPRPLGHRGLRQPPPHF